jgi:hypothetical protein
VARQKTTKRALSPLAAAYRVNTIVNNITTGIYSTQTKKPAKRITVEKPERSRASALDATGGTLDTQIMHLQKEID